MAAGISQNKVVSYYDYTLPFYRMFWHGSSNGIHYGYWDGRAHSLSEAILAMNGLLASKGRITAADRVLDAGCGVGGSSFWLAEHIGASAVGITVSERQRRQAEKLAMRKGLNEKVSFVTGDYLATPFPDLSFDVVWGLESMCYGQQRAAELAREMHRVLRPGGRIVVADGFLGKGGVFTEREASNVAVFEEGFALPGLVTPDTFKAALISAGFRTVAYEEITERILPTARYMYYLCLPGYAGAYVGEKLGIFSPILTKNNLTGIVQRELFESRTLVYATFYAEKC